MISSATKDSANDAKNDLKNTAYSAKRDFENAAGNAADNISEVANRTGRKVRGYLDSANEQFSDVTDRVATEVRSNPVRSSLIALGIGYILGNLFTR